MSRPRLRVEPDHDRLVRDGARRHGLRRRHQLRLDNARGRELTHECKACGTVVRLIDYVRHIDICEGPA